MNQISPRISNLRTIPSEPNVDARIAVTSQSPDRTQEIFPILSREGNDARPGLIIDSVSHHYNSYARPPMRSSDYPQGGPYDHLNPPSALDLSILDGYPQGGPYDHLNPPPAPDPSALVDQGQHADAPDIGLINGALPISYKQNGPQ